MVSVATYPVQTVDPLTECCEAIAALLCQVELRLYQDLRQSIPVAQLQQRYCQTYGISGRQFQALYTTLRQKCDRARHQHQRSHQHLKQQIQALERAIAHHQANLPAQQRGYPRLSFAQRTLVHRLYRQRQQLHELKQVLQTPPALTLGSPQGLPIVLDASYQPPPLTGSPKSQLASLQQWLVYLHVPDFLQSHFGPYLAVSDLKFPQGERVVLAQLQHQRPVEFRCVHQPHGWQVLCWVPTASETPQGMTPSRPMSQRWPRWSRVLINFLVLAIGIRIGLAFTGIPLHLLSLGSSLASERLDPESVAQQRWTRAQALTRQATAIAANGDRSPETLKIVHRLRQQALETLQAIPAKTTVASVATQALPTYQQALTTATQELDAAQSAFLREIAQTLMAPEQVMISVCHLQGECRHFQGDRPPASPASLIKLPVAVVLMHKVKNERVNLKTVVEVSDDNYTEEGSAIRVDRKYTLEQLLKVMIDHSSNIATNQLIDYLGRDYINEILRKQGYKITQVHSKLVGQKTYPTNTGKQPNRITANELTNMMRQIYNRQYPGSDVLIKALQDQHDRVLGYAALQGSGATWLGEKTGQNSRMLGTTVAMKVKGEIYVMTLMLNASGDEAAIRRGIRAVADHLVNQGL
ncbi:serine hydrolase [Trichothermofontia sp.]